jgi:hypothetical protein
LTWNTATSGISASTIDSINATGPSWTYIRPTGWKRLRDFDGYNHTDKLTPFQAIGMPYDGITKAESGTTSTTHIFFECYWHQRASQIQPKDMAIFGDYASSYYLKMGVLVKDPSKSSAQLCLLYDSLSAANTGSTTSAINMPLSVSSDTHYTKKYFKVPNTTSSSTAVWKALLVCVRINKSSGDMAWIPLPTMTAYNFTVDTAVGDVSTFWAISRSDMRPLTLVVPQEQNGYYMLQEVYMTNIFTGLKRFFDSTNLNFKVEYELYMNGSQLGRGTITESTSPLATSGSGELTEYTYRTSLRNSGTFTPVASWSDLMVYVSVSLNNADNNNNTIYLRLDQIMWQGNYMLIPKGSTTRVGYSMQSIMDALGTGYYQIVTSI